MNLMAVLRFYRQCVLFRSKGPRAAVCWGRPSYVPDSASKLFRRSRLSWIGATAIQITRNVQKWRQLQYSLPSILRGVLTGAVSGFRSLITAVHVARSKLVFSSSLLF